MMMKQEVWYVEAFEKKFMQAQETGVHASMTDYQAKDYEPSSVTIFELLLIFGSTQAWPRENYPRYSRIIRYSRAMVR